MYQYFQACSFFIGFKMNLEGKVISFSEKDCDSSHKTHLIYFDWNSVV